MSKSKSRIDIDYHKIALYIGIFVCILSIAFGYGLYKKQSFKTIFYNLINSIMYSGRNIPTI